MIVKCVNSVDPDDSSLTWHSTCSSPIPTSKKSPSGNGLPEVCTCCPSKVVPKLYWDNSQLSQVTLSRSYEKHCTARKNNIMPTRGRGPILRLHSSRRGPQTNCSLHGNGKVVPVSLLPLPTSYQTFLVHSFCTRYSSFALYRSSKTNSIKQ